MTPQLDVRRLKSIRKARRLSLRKLAARAEVRYATIHDWEAGRTMPTAVHLALVARALSVSMDYLMGLTDYREMGI